MFGMEGRAGFLAECIGLKIEKILSSSCHVCHVMCLMAGWQSKGMVT